MGNKKVGGFMVVQVSVPFEVEEMPDGTFDIATPASKTYHTTYLDSATGKEWAEPTLCAVKDQVMRCALESALIGVTTHIEEQHAFDEAEEKPAIKKGLPQ